MTPTLPGNLPWELGSPRNNLQQRVGSAMVLTGNCLWEDLQIGARGRELVENTFALILVCVKIAFWEI